MVLGELNLHAHISIVFGGNGQRTVLVFGVHCQGQRFGGSCHQLILPDEIIPEFPLEVRDFLQVVPGTQVALIDEVTVVVDAHRHSILAGEIGPGAVHIGQDGVILHQQCPLPVLLEEERQGDNVFRRVLRRYAGIVGR